MGVRLWGRGRGGRGGEEVGGFGFGFGGGGLVGVEGLVGVVVQVGVRVGGGGLLRRGGFAMGDEGVLCVAFSMLAMHAYIMYVYAASLSMTR